jgi:hypothetical protein
VTKYYSGDKIKEDKMGRACCTYGEKRNVYSVFVGKSDGKRPLGRPSCR